MSDLFYSSAMSACRFETPMRLVAKLLFNLSQTDLETYKLR